MESNIFFKPRYDKEKYEKGYKGYRTLILGVFHVCRTECKFREDCFKNTAKYDRECPVYKGREEYYSLSNSNEIEVESYLEECDSHYSYSYITKYFFRTNKSVPEDKKRDFWDSIAFTNFLQNMHMSYTTLEYEKNKEMFNNNIPAFMTLLDELQPEVIYVIDKAVKDCLCAEGNEINGLEFVDSYEDWQVPIYRFTYKFKSKDTLKEILTHIEEKKIYSECLKRIDNIKDLAFKVKKRNVGDLDKLLYPHVLDKRFVRYLALKAIEIDFRTALKQVLELKDDITNDIVILADIIYNSIRDKEGTQQGVEEKYIVYTNQYMRDGFFIELLEELNLHLDKKIKQFDFIRAVGIECENAEVWRTIRKKQYSDESKLPYYDEKGKLVYIIKQNNGKDTKTMKTIKLHLKEIITNKWKNIIKEQISN